MKPTVIPNASAAANSRAGIDGSAATSNGIQIPVHQEYSTSSAAQPHYMQNQQPQNSDATGSPSTAHPHLSQQQFHQGLGGDANIDMDIDMFPRRRFGGLMHDPFTAFGGSRKRNSFHEPKDDFSHYFDDAADFGFPEFGSIGRRRAADHMNDSDFFNRLPSEFRSYIPDGFGHRRSNAPTNSHHSSSPQAAGTQYYQHGFAPNDPTAANVNVTQLPAKNLCDAAIQTEDPSTMSGLYRDDVDGVAASLPQQADLNQHGLRNTVDMGVKSDLENEQQQGNRSQSAPPTEQQTKQQRSNLAGRPTFATTQTQSEGVPHQQTSQYPKSYYAPHQEPHPQQNMQSRPAPQAQPQTPGSATIRTIPIFVEGRSEPIINLHKDIPGQNSTNQQPTVYATTKNSTPQTRQQQQQQQQQQQPQQPQRPSPLNTQQQMPQKSEESQIPPQTPHTLDSISKIQDIQRDVLDLMSKVEKFAGTRQDKEYVYLDEMLTRNLLKLDTIDTNGKDSIRLARKEAIKCIQASINVLEAKAEENTKAAAGQQEVTKENESQVSEEKLQQNESSGSINENKAKAEEQISQSQETTTSVRQDGLENAENDNSETSKVDTNKQTDDSSHTKTDVEVADNRAEASN